jgi:hypothetical protein
MAEGNNAPLPSAPLGGCAQGKQADARNPLRGHPVTHHMRRWRAGGVLPDRVEGGGAGLGRAGKRQEPGRAASPKGLKKPKGALPCARHRNLAKAIQEAEAPRTVLSAPLG